MLAAGGVEFIRRGLFLSEGWKRLFFSGDAGTIWSNFDTARSIRLADRIASIVFMLCRPTVFTVRCRLAPDGGSQLQYSHCKRVPNRPLRSADLEPFCNSWSAGF